MPDYQLIPHPDFPSSAVTAIRVTAERRENHLDFWFWLSGNPDRLLITGDYLDGMRVDGLWKHTCFEAFVRAESQTAYKEFNWSPSAGWAAYAFDNYRAGMRDIPASGGSPIVSLGYHSGFEDGYVWSFLATDEHSQEVALSLGLSAVIEAKDGSKSYWALAHAPGPPDFHNPDCFIATLPAPDAT